MQQCAKDSAEEYALGAEAVLNKFYIDDYLQSFHELTTALKTRQELETILGLGGLELGRRQAK